MGGVSLDRARSWVQPRSAKAEQALAGPDIRVPRIGIIIGMTVQLPSAPRTPQIDLDIEGMTCASCVRRVERALTALPEVTAATVNLATEKALVTLTPAASADDAWEAAARAVGAAGYSVRAGTPTTVEGTAHIRMAITGMTCASCVRRVERALLGVDEESAPASVNLTKEMADVVLTTPVDAARLVAAVAGAGYDAEVLSGRRSAPGRGQERRARRQAAIRSRSWVLAVGLALSTGVPPIGAALAMAFSLCHRRPQRPAPPPPRTPIVNPADSGSPPGTGRRGMTAR